jgi:SAM-dependent methyltransferase
VDGVRDAGGDEVVSGTLVSDEGERFEIREGVPRMVPAEDSSANVDDGATKTSFGAKWAAYKEEEKEPLAEWQYGWYEERYGFDGEAALGRFLSDKGRILDAGTGLGLHAARYARLSDAAVVGMDLTDSVTLASHRHGSVPNLEYVQGDILSPPFLTESFDFVVSDQVIHHTPDCSRAFRTLAGLVAPGGQIAVYVYKRKALLRELTDDAVRDITTRMSVDECLEFSEQITELGRQLSHLDATITLERGIPLLGIEPGEHDVQRLIYWTMLKCFWHEELGEHHSVMVNFDWYHPPFASRHTREEVLGWCSEAGLEVAHLDVMESGISVRADKPA